MTRTLGKWCVVLISLFALFFAMALMLLLLLPLSMEHAIGAGPSIPLGFWSQVRYAAMIGGMLAGVGTLLLLLRNGEDRLDARVAKTRRRRAASR
jgi:membrane associated rhomboid family serine protease